MRRNFFLLSLFLLVPKILLSQDHSKLSFGSSPLFYLQTFDTPCLDGSTTVEFDIQTVMTELSFSRGEEGGYFARWRTSILILRDTKAVLHRSVVDTLGPIAVRETMDINSSRVLRDYINLQPGSYSYRIRVTDLSTNKSSEIHGDLNIGEVDPDLLTLSSLRLTPTIKRDPEKNVLETKPQAALVFSPLDQEVIYIYASMIGIVGQDTARVICRLFYKDVTWNIFEQLLPILEHKEVLMAVPLKISTLPDGNWKVKLEVILPDQTASRAQGFTIVNSRALWLKI